MSTDKDFIIKVRSGNPLLVVNSYEEFRVLEQYVRDLSATPIKDPQTGRTVSHYKTYSWDIESGVRLLSIDPSSKTFQIGGEPLKIRKPFDQAHQENPELTLEQWVSEDPTESTVGDPTLPLEFLKQADNGSVIFLKDYQPYFTIEEYEQPKVVKRIIRNLTPVFRGQGKCIVFLSPSLKVPTELEKEVAIIDFTLPSRDTLKAVLEGVIGPNTPTNKLMPKGEALEAVLDAAAGMTTIEAENAFASSLIVARKIDAGIIRAEKANVVKKSGLLEIIEATETMDDIGGLQNLKAWINTKKNTFTKAAKDFGTKAVKGVLLLGVPGCGKSLTAKAAASGLQRPLVRLDMGKIYGSYVGESEQNMSHCLQILKSISPCILWIDEIEKGLSGNKNGQEGHETTRRVFQMLLTWMQEKKEDVMLFATANSIDSLPPELLRAGRIDATFYVDLPDAEQRTEIFKIHLRKSVGASFPNGRNPEMFNEHLPELMRISENFTGAEIEVWISEAVTRAYNAGHADVQIEDLRGAVNEVTPIFRLQYDEIKESRRKARERGTKLAAGSWERTASAVPSQGPIARRVSVDTDAPAN